LFEGSDPINLMMTESANHVIIMPMASVADLAAEIGRLLDALWVSGVSALPSFR